jgi:hypothetical protein
MPHQQRAGFARRLLDEWKKVVCHDEASLKPGFKVLGSKSWVQILDSKSRVQK